MFMFKHSLVLSSLLMAAAAVCPAADRCRSTELGVKEIAGNGSFRIVSTARVSANANDDESIRLAVAQGELNAKDQLLRYRTQKKLVAGTLAGIILRRACAEGSFLYVTVETSESLRRDSRSLRQQMKESLSRTPTSTAR